MSLPKLFSLLTIMVYVLQGCTTNTPITKPKKETSIIDFTADLRYQTSAGLNGAVIVGGGQFIRGLSFLDRGFDVLERTSSPDIKLKYMENRVVNNDGYNAMATEFVPEHKHIKNAAHISERYSEACRARSGYWRSPKCEHYSGLPLFFAKVSQKNRFVRVYVVEPTSSLENDDYKRALRAAGWSSRDEIAKKQQIQAEKEEKRQRKKQLWQQRLNASAINVSKNAQRGSRICSMTEKNRIITTAYVLSRTNSGKLEIRIHSTLYANSSVGPTAGGLYGTAGTITFVKPYGWRICELEY